MAIDASDEENAESIELKNKNANNKKPDMIDYDTTPDEDLVPKINPLKNVPSCRQLNVTPNSDVKGMYIYLHMGYSSYRRIIAFC